MEAPPLHPDAMAHLRSLQQHMQDIVVLLSSRFMDQALLQKRGMPQVLISRWEAAFTIEGIQDNLLWCRLGDSKSHIFRKDEKPTVSDSTAPWSCKANKARGELVYQTGDGEVAVAYQTGAYQTGGRSLTR